MKLSGDSVEKADDSIRTEDGEEPTRWGVDKAQTIASALQEDPKTKESLDSYFEVSQEKRKQLSQETRHREASNKSERKMWMRLAKSQERALKKRS